MRSLLLVVATALVVLGGVLVFAPGGEDGTARGQAFHEDSAWNTPLTGREPRDRDNARMRRDLARQPHDGSWTGPNARYGTGVDHVTNADRRVRVRCTKYCERGRVPRSFRIPEDGPRIPGRVGDDRHYAIVNDDTGEELDFWQARWNPRTRTLSGSTVILLHRDGPGFCAPAGRQCNSATAAGNALTAGLITPDDLRKGRIDHTLSMVIWRARARYIACPATHTDGESVGRQYVPEGARVTLPRRLRPNPEWDRVSRMVFRALQRYGAIITDKGSWGFQFGPSNADWSGTGLEDGPIGYPDDFPWDDLQVLKLRRCG